VGDYCKALSIGMSSGGGSGMSVGGSGGGSGGGGSGGAATDATDDSEEAYCAAMRPLMYDAAELAGGGFHTPSFSTFSQLNFSCHCLTSSVNSTCNHMCNICTTQDIPLIVFLQMFL